MTVANITPSVDYLEDGVSTNFPLPFRFLNPSDIKVVRELSDGSTLNLVYGVDYTVTGGSSDAGGTLAVRAAAAAGAKLHAWRLTARSQTATYKTADRFPAQSHEAALDKAGLIDQEQDVDIGRAIKVPRGKLAPELGDVAPGEVITRNGDRLEGLSVDDFTAPARNAATEAANFATILQNFVMGMWYATPEEGVDPVTGVSPGRSYQVLSAGRLSGWVNRNGVPLGPLYSFATIAEFAKFFGDRPVNPCDAPYFAAGDGVTNDNAAFLAALESGRMVDGGGRTFAIRNVLRPSIFAGLRNCKLKWLDPADHPTGALLDIIDISGFEISDVAIDIGAETNTGSAGDSDRNGLRIHSSEPGVTAVEGFRVSRVDVTGDGHGSRIQIRGARRFQVEGCYVHDGVASYNVDPSNDIANGFDFKHCTNFTFANNRVDRLLAVIGGTAVNLNTRGYLVAECQDFLDVNNSASMVGQGCDYSGAITGTDPIGVRGFSKIGGVYTDCGYFGIKFANVARDGLVSDVLVIRPGMIGVVASGSNVPLTGAAEQLNTQNIDFHDCKVVDPTGLNGYASQGFRAMRNVNSPSWPRGIRFHNCVAVDTQAVPKMAYGFANDVLYDGASLQINEAIGCISRGHVDDAMQGMQSWTCRLTGNANQSVPSSTATAIHWTLDQADSVEMHSTSANTDLVTIPVSGRWLIQASVNYAAAAGGYRRAEVRRNGNAVNGGVATQAAVDGNPTVVRHEIDVTCVAGDTIKVEAYQNTGAPLDVQMGNSFFSATLLEQS